MCDDKTLFEIMEIIHKNGNGMLRENLRIEINFDELTFNRYVKKLENAGFVGRGHGSQKVTNRYIYLTESGKKIFD